MKSVKRWLLYFLGIVTLALGLTLNTKTGLGTSPIISAAFAIATIFNFTVGDITLIEYLLFVIFECMLKDKFEKEISPVDLFDLDPKDYVLVDLRSNYDRSIRGAINILDIEDRAKNGELDLNKSYILFKDKRAYEEADTLQSLGYDAINLKGGYLGYLRDSLNTPFEDRQYKAEHSIIKTYRKELLTPF